MVDRLEELLAMLEDEEEEEREDIPGLTDRTAPAAVSPEKDDGEASAAGDGRGGRRNDPAAPDSGEAGGSTGEITDGGVGAPILPPAPVPAPAGRSEEPEHFTGETAGVDGGASVEPLKRSADEAAGVDNGTSVELPKRPADEAEGVDGGTSVEPPKRSADEAAGADSAASAEEPERPAGGTADERGDELIWRLDIGAVQRAEAAWRRALADRPDGAAAEAVRMTAEGTMGAAAERLSVEKGGELGRVVRHESESGLEGLYRQTVRASRPAPQALPVEQAGRTARAEEPGRTAALTVDELDRAVRRDSRRYDGGMTIF